MIGIGVMVRDLTGNGDTANAYTQALGKRITKLWLGEDNILHLRFEDGTGVGFYDAGQSCCESRYMRTDDDLPYYVGARLTGAEVKKAPNVESDDEWGMEHEVRFLEIQTDRGSFTMANHNEHNGYYGGFALEVCAETEEEVAC